MNVISPKNLGVFKVFNKITKETFYTDKLDKTYGTFQVIDIYRAIKEKGVFEDIYLIVTLENNLPTQ